MNTSLVALLVAALIPVLNIYAFEGLQKLLGLLDRASPLVKTLIALVLPVGLNLLTGWLGIPNLSSDLATWTPAITLGLLQGLASIGIHAKQAQKIKGTTELNPVT